ncbi:cell wall hydrolase [Sphingomonas sp. H39-1-10]|uniref:cell wall hydrolase n=1 Tax=Sphingomonas pollutisoli TaxID=3030829 RepID=UPI0023B9BA0C|nr:cell wall hydrolase [Sphingomonas pollutisoli]MDF0486892.1 cell wall hydrolase [Sphingomonas pollutisoli]
MPSPPGPESRPDRALTALHVAGLALLVCAGVSAHAAYRAIEEQAARAAPVTTIASGYEAQEHFPGAALLYAGDDSAAAALAAPARGTTGTIALPDLPLPPEAASFATADGSIHPAAPFDMRRASALDRGRALDCLTTAIYYEAATEPDAGQQAVAQVILNRVRHPAFPATVCGVVYQGSEHSGCQFSFACDGAMTRGQPARASWLRALRVAAAALGGYVYAPVGLATHYHTYAVTPAWNRHLVMTAAIGAHFFHRWQGWWGTPGAFRQIYAGGEPVPGPHARIIEALPVPAITLAATAPAPVVAKTAPATIQPAYAQSGTLLTPARTAEARPGDSQILDRWKDSGKLLQ